MSNKYCEDCGSKVYNGRCTNCHEELYIAEQYYEEGMPCDWSQEFSDKVKQQEKEVKEKNQNEN